MAESSVHTKVAAAAESAKRDADLRAQYVIVPRGDEAQTVSCPICKELLKSEFLEDDEDWVWKNATKKDDKVLYSSSLIANDLYLNALTDLPRNMLCGGGHFYEHPCSEATQ